MFMSGLIVAMQRYTQIPATVNVVITDVNEKNWAKLQPICAN